MIFSPETKQILQNFSKFNNQLSLKYGNIIRTTDGSVVVDTRINETIPCDFDIYDLRKFLHNLELFDEVTFSESKSIMTSGNQRFEFPAGEIDIKLPSSINFPEPDITLILTKSMLERIEKISRMNDLSMICIYTDNNKLYLSLVNPNNTTSESWTVDLDIFYEDADVNLYIKTEHLKFLSSDYELQIVSKLYTQFSSNTYDLRYYIPVIRKGSYFTYKN